MKLLLPFLFLISFFSMHAMEQGEHHRQQEFIEHLYKQKFPQLKPENQQAMVKALLEDYRKELADKVSKDKLDEWAVKGAGTAAAVPGGILSFLYAEHLVTNLLHRGLRGFETKFWTDGWYYSSSWFKYGKIIEGFPVHMMETLGMKSHLNLAALSFGSIAACVAAYKYFSHPSYNAQMAGIDADIATATATRDIRVLEGLIKKYYPHVILNDGNRQQHVFTFEQMRELANQRRLSENQ